MKFIFTISEIFNRTQLFYKTKSHSCHVINVVDYSLTVRQHLLRDSV